MRNRQNNTFFFNTRMATIKHPDTDTISSSDLEKYPSSKYIKNESTK